MMALPTYVLLILLFQYFRDHRDLHSFPTRRSSDLSAATMRRPPVPTPPDAARWCARTIAPTPSEWNGRAPRPIPDRKSTRLNSSHSSISYAVFCLKKKTTHQQTLHE